jgi:hypothetical protein
VITAPAVDTLRAELTTAAEGLRYVSEADHPFDFVSYPNAPADALTPQRVAEIVGKPGAPVEEVPLERFFAGMIESADPADAATQALVPRFRALRELLRRRMPDVRVFRVGQVEMECYLLGTVQSGGVAGLHTQALET